MFRHIINLFIILRRRMSADIVLWLVPYITMLKHENEFQYKNETVCKIYTFVVDYPSVCGRHA